MKTTLAVVALLAVASCAARAPAAPPPAAPAPVAAHTERSGTTNTLYDIGCLTASRCFAVGALSAGDGGTLPGTTDRGRTWHRYASPCPAPVCRIACSPP